MPPSFVAIEMFENFFVGLVAVPICKTLYTLHPFAMFIAEVFDDLRCAMGAGVMFDEAADETDDHGTCRTGRQRVIFNRSEWERALPCSKRLHQRQGERELAGRKYAYSA